ncbi:phosphate-starvation-inducible PsiE family protein [Merismopedia glauca]|uniref:Phosphate-starvation-inducible E-like protein n=1 Tax=Merismopedia glauca CCAP 1448/3 TaxID=1296344 RepID=A0A2T1C182_9CYAN|nr:phosphate-starvation-inducible PsiE family protein [Merismopedia glauca]PSB02002.1 hypothetical protein C7B64_15250 [Merismopedia glauca CCAP 1448/3]
MWRQIKGYSQKIIQDGSFLTGLKIFENIIAKMLSVAMVIVILAGLLDLFILLYKELTTPPFGLFAKSLISILGLFLDILIALEILENITAYLKKHTLQVELVVATSIVAIARKFVILDLEKTSGNEVIGLALGILALSISYLIVKKVNQDS